MERFLVLALGTLLALSNAILETQLQTASGDSEVPRELRQASHPSLKYISADSPYMRSER